MSKRFVTLFPPSQNVHLLKDVGMIPYVLHRDCGYDSTLVAFRNDTEYPALEREVKGLKMEFIENDPTYQFTKPSRKVVSYLWKNARKIDILNLYHNTQETLMYGLIYKLRNPSGVLYLKLDINIERFEESVTSLKMKGYNFFFRKMTSLVSYELDFAGDYLRNRFPVLKDKLIKVTNGIDDRLIKDAGIKRLPFQNKENLIITVGRIGAPEKNNEMLLKALKQVELDDWSVAFIGPIEQSFLSVIETFYKENPALKDRIQFVGGVSDRKQLYDWYNRAKVFCLTSDWESFGIVFVEALYFGNYIVSTEVASINELTNNERIGKVVHTEDELANVLQKIVNKDIPLEDTYDQTLEQSKKYRWTDIAASLHQRLATLTKN